MVVVALEVIDIDHDRRDLRERPLPEFLQGFIQTASIEEGGELVVAG